MANLPNNERILQALANELALDPQLQLRDQPYKKRVYGKLAEQPRNVSYPVCHSGRRARRSEHSRAKLATRGVMVVSYPYTPKQRRVECLGVTASVGNRTGFGETPGEALLALARLYL